MMEVYEDKYTTVQGDTWDMISLQLYGTPHKVAQLIACNAEYSDVLIFDGNIELSVPVITNNTTNTLAPWKRGA